MPNQSSIQEWRNMLPVILRLLFVTKYCGLIKETGEAMISYSKCTFHIMRCAAKRLGV